MIFHLVLIRLNRLSLRCVQLCLSLFSCNQHINAEWFTIIEIWYKIFNRNIYNIWNAYIISIRLLYPLTAVISWRLYQLFLGKKKLGVFVHTKLGPNNDVLQYSSTSCWPKSVVYSLTLSPRLTWATRGRCDKRTENHCEWHGLWVWRVLSHRNGVDIPAKWR